MSKKLLQRDSGFTLIEIVVVLAIAAILLVVVIAAVGGAQRQRRDTARVQTVGNLASAMESYASNNTGSYPAAGTALSASYLSSVNDPSGIAPAAQAGTAAGVAATAAAPIQYSSNAICGGTTTGTAGYTNTGATTRNWAISYWSEVAGASSCRDNK